MRVRYGMQAIVLLKQQVDNIGLCVYGSVLQDDEHDH